MSVSDHLLAIYKRLLCVPTCAGHSRSVKALYSIPLFLLGTLQSDSSRAATEVIKTKYQYSAKVLCSIMLPHQDGGLARGT